MAKKELPEDEGVSQEWLASYADAMTLLLAFFIMMFAFALIDEGKYFDFKVGVMAALGVPDPLTDNTDSILEKGTGITPEIGLTPLTPSEAQELAVEDLREAISAAGTITAENADELRDYLELQFELAGAGEYVDVGIDERGVFIRFDGRVLFESGRAELDENGLILLATAADVLGLIDNALEVEGHTDSDATDGVRWPSNWELSTARASRVVRWMIAPGELPSTRLTALGKADTKPRATNNTEEGKQQNRRVEIVTRIAQLPTMEEQELLDGVASENDTENPGDGTTEDEPTGEEPTGDDTTDDTPTGDDQNENQNEEPIGETVPDEDGVEVVEPDEEEPVDLLLDGEDAAGPTLTEDIEEIDPIGNPLNPNP